MGDLQSQTRVCGRELLIILNWLIILPFQYLYPSVYIL